MFKILFGGTLRVRFCYSGLHCDLTVARMTEVVGEATLAKLTTTQAEAVLTNYALLMMQVNKRQEAVKALNDLEKLVPSNVYPALIHASMQAKEGGSDAALAALEVSALTGAGLITEG